MKKHAVLSLLLLAILATSCQALKKQPSRLTSATTRREGQLVWFTEDDLTTTIRIIASCISASEMATDYFRATRKYAECLRVCYTNLSSEGKDEDGGVRGLNLIRKLHFEADGSKAFWNDVLKQAKSTSIPDMPGLPIPADY